MTRQYNINNFLHFHRKNIILIALLTAITAIAAIVIYVLLFYNTSGKSSESLEVRFFIPKTAASQISSLDVSFDQANESLQSAEYFFENRSVIANDLTLSYNSKEKSALLYSEQLLQSYPINAESYYTALSNDNELLLAYSEDTNGNLCVYAPFKPELLKSEDIICAAGTNLGCVYSNGTRIYYVDRKKRTVCSVLPDFSDLKNESIVRVSAYFVNVNTIYYAVGEMLYVKKSSDTDAKWLYQCDGYITHLLASDSYVYLGWEDEDRNLCAARFDASSNSCTYLGGNPQ